MNDLEHTASGLMEFVKHISLLKRSKMLPTEKNIEDATLLCDYLIEFSRRFSDQINIMAPAMKEIQSLMCR